MIILRESERDQLIENMVSNLPVLRAMLHLSQLDLAQILDISRQQVAAIETRKRKLTWIGFLALLFVFYKNEETRNLLIVFHIYTDQLSNYIQGRSVCGNPKEEEHGKI